MNFSIDTTEGLFRYPQDLKNNWMLLFYYSGDFLPVTATEMFGLAELQAELRAHQCRALCISQDTVAVHLAFLESLSRHRGKTQIDCPLGCDPKGKLQAELQLDPTKKYIWLLAPGGTPQAHFSYPHRIGANFTEVLRTLLALQTQKPTPYGWVPGAHTLALPPATHTESRHFMQEQEKAGGIAVDWYLCFEGE